MSQMMPASRPPSGPANGGTITDQVRTLEVGANGQAVAGIRVYFKTAKGQLGSVFVEESRYSSSAAIAAARAMANELDGAHGQTI